MGETGGDATTRWFTRVAALVLLAIAVIGAAFHEPLDWGIVAFTLVGVVIIWHRPTNTIGWLLALIGSLPQIPLGLTPVGIALIAYVVLLFPSGSLPSRRWRWPTRVASGALAVIWLVQLFRPDGGRFPMDWARPLVAVLAPMSANVFGLFGLASLVSVFRRTRRAHGDEREQLRWFGASAVPFPVLMFLNGSTNGRFILVAFTVGIACIPAGIGVAVLKYRLYAIDVVINKALVFGALAAFITLIYVGVVAGIGAVVGSGDRANFGLSLLATAVVALAFGPVRERLQRLANRFVYGTRLSPYEAVAGFAHRLAEFVAPDEVLPEMAEAAAVGVGAARARVRLFLPGRGEESVYWPAGTTDGDFDRVLPVMDRGEQVGEIAVAKGRGDQVSAQDERLLADLVSEAGLAMRSLRLTEELKARLVDLAESRRRLVAAQDDERRRMERDIHDGAQQQLVAMKMKLGLAKAMLEADPEAVGPLLDDLAANSTEAINTLRDLARGLFPQVLVDGGLVAALRSHIAKSDLPARLEADPTMARLDLQTEANVYFVVREALQNASKYAPGAAIAVTLADVDSGLGFTVADEGPGFDPATAKTGSGTQNMRDRIEALGGHLEMVSAPGEGSEVRGWVPRDQVIHLQDDGTSRTEVHATAAPTSTVA